MPTDPSSNPKPENSGNEPDESGQTTGNQMPKDEEDESKRTFVHVIMKNKREDIVGMGEGVKCNRPDCPGPEKWEVSFGMAGGGYGVYHYCNTCGEVKEKDCEPE